MSLSKRSIETLIDLIEIKLGCMEIYDREDARELATLENCRRELLGLAARSQTNGKVGGQIVTFDTVARA